MATLDHIKALFTPATLKKFVDENVAWMYEETEPADVISESFQNMFEKEMKWLASCIDETSRRAIEMYQRSARPILFLKGAEKAPEIPSDPNVLLPLDPGVEAKFSEDIARLTEEIFKQTQIPKL